MNLMSQAMYLTSQRNARISARNVVRGAKVMRILRTQSALAANIIFYRVRDRDQFVK
jgi:hypothetical protein